MAKSKDDNVREKIKTLIGATIWVGKATLWVLTWYGAVCLYDDNYHIKTVTRTEYVPVQVIKDLEAREEPDHHPADE
jgi:hypothetical protein